MAGQSLGNVSLASLKETLLFLPHCLALGKCPREALVAGVAVRKGGAAVSLPQGFQAQGSGSCEAASLAVGRACFWPRRCAEQPESTA